MKAEGITITGADIAYVSSEDKKRKIIVKVKQEKASDDEAVKVTTSEEKKVAKKSRVKLSMKSKAARVRRRMIVQNEDSEDTEEE
ncbi:hypothetical protein A2U01_0079679, partial [Trifolium medium]|nr:hypothetical protein [Trifolium medium]